VEYGTPNLPLRKRIYEYWGVRVHEGQTYHLFYPYKHDGKQFVMRDEHIIATIKEFKPFIMDCVELGFVRQTEGDFNGPVA
jgi:hypothetical protein